MDDLEAKNRAIEEDVRSLCEKHGLENAAFCASDTANGNFIGIFHGPMTQVDMWKTVINVGRFWQHCRNSVRDELNRYERKQGW